MATDNGFLTLPRYSHAAESTTSLSDGGTLTAEIKCRGAQQIAIAAVSNGTYNLDVQWYDDADFTNKLGATNNLASGTAADTGTETTVNMASPFAKVILTDTTSDATEATATITAHAS